MALALFSWGRNPTELTLLSKKCGPLGPFFYSVDILPRHNANILAI